MSSTSSTAVPLATRIPTRLGWKGNVNKYSLIASDIITFLLAALLANLFHWIYLGTPADAFLQIWTAQAAQTRLSIFASLVLIGIGWFWILGHYTRRRPYWDEIAELIRVIAILAVLDATLLYLAKLQFSRFWFLTNWLLALGLLPFTRLVVKRTLAKLGFWQRAAVIFGTGPNAIEAAEAIQSEQLMGFRTAAFIHPPSAEGPSPSQVEVQGQRYPVIAMPENPAHALDDLGQPAIIVAVEQIDLTRDAFWVARLHRFCQDLRVVPPVRGVPLFGASVHHFFRHELFFLTLRNNLARRAPRMLKRAFDIVVASTLLVLLSPLFLYLAFAIKKDGGPVFFAHGRVGRENRAFRCIKFRTMVPNAQAVLQDLLDSNPTAKTEWGKDFKLKNDPRVTKIGKLLRE
jgi:undecaprenyl-phosphate galactose phosphotransferase